MGPTGVAYEVVAGAAEHAQLIVTSEELAHERRLADARRARHEHDPPGTRGGVAMAVESTSRAASRSRMRRPAPR